jgi:hypothetical protein
MVKTIPIMKINGNIVVTLFCMLVPSINLNTHANKTSMPARIEPYPEIDQLALLERKTTIIPMIITMEGIVFMYKNISVFMLLYCYI